MGVCVGFQRKGIRKYKIEKYFTATYKYDWWQIGGKKIKCIAIIVF
jgi:hypothetical protein